jgi:HTH-type transcriptional regulator, global nitrogen regulator NrpRI
MDRKSSNYLAILKTLRGESQPLSAVKIAAALAGAGCDLSERSVRLYLNDMEARGLVRQFGKRGSVLTTAGAEELRTSQPWQRVGFLSAKIDQMTYAMDFDLPTRSGRVVVNTSLVAPGDLLACIEDVCTVFGKGFAMGTRVCLLGPGESVGESAIPAGQVGFCTVCSITLNGVLLKHGIPTRSRFGGLLQVRDYRPERFVEIIDYEGTSIDPLEVFIRSGMTDYLGAIRGGCGRIGASFREVPSGSGEMVAALAERLTEIGLGAFMEIGQGGRPVLDIPVSEGRTGAIVVGGLNPISVIHERGFSSQSRALSGLLEFTRLFSYEDLPQRLKAMMR